MEEDEELAVYDKVSSFLKSLFIRKMNNSV